MASLGHVFYAEWVKLWRRRLTWGIVLALIAILGLQVRGLVVKVRAEPSIPDKVDAYIEAQRASWPQWEMGIAVLVARDGQVLVNKGYGLADREKGVPLTPDTILPIASISKQFTAVAVMQLVEAGLLRTEDSLATFYPDYPRSDEITIHHLLTHSSGLPNAMEPMVPAALDSDPGTEASYSNVNDMLLGGIVEQVSGLSYADYVRERIMAPLGMSDSGYDVGTAADRSRVATGYARGPDGPVAVSYESLDRAGGAGALYSTVSDLYLWERALGTGELLRTETWDQVYHPHYPWQEYGMGYGWAIGEAFGRTMAIHGGSLDGVVGSIVHFLDEDAAIIVLSNSGWAPVTQITEDLAAILFGEHYVSPRQHHEQVVDLDPLVFDAYLGEYELADMGAVVIPMREGKQYYLQLKMATGETQMALYPLSETRFLTDRGDGEIEFVLDEEGQAIQIVMTAGGQQLAPAIRRGASVPVLRASPELDEALEGLDLQPSVSDWLEGVTLPGVLNRLPRMADWLTVALVLLGVSLVGQEFSWGTVRTVLSRGVPRVQFVLVKLLVFGAFSACLVVVLWAACGAMGWWATRQLVGEVDWRFADRSFWVAQVGIVLRTWCIVLAAAAGTVAVYVWAGSPGPALSLRVLGFVFSLLAYLALMMLPLLILTRPDVDPAAFGDTAGARLVELVPHYNSRLVAHWGRPADLYETDRGVWVMAQLLHLDDDPWHAVLRLGVYGLLPVIGALIGFARREMRP